MGLINAATAAVWNGWHRIFNARRSAPDVSSGRQVFWGPRTPAGIFVNEEMALTHTTVWSCIRGISEDIAHPPWRARFRTEAGSELYDTHPADRLLYRRPNPEQTPFAWRRHLVASALLWGNGYAEIEFDNGGRPVALWPIQPDRVSVERSDRGIFYRVRAQSVAGQERIFASWEIFHLPGPFSLDGGITGVSPIQYAARAIGLGIAVEEFGSTYFGNNARPGGVLQHPGTLSAEAQERLKNDYIDRFSKKNAHKPLILEEGMTWSSLTIPPEDSQFLETRQFNVLDICRLYRYPPHKVGELGRATWSNIEHQSISYVQDVLLPLAKALEQEADYKLISKDNVDAYTHINLKGLMRGDDQSRAAYYQSMFSMGVLSPNDIRELEDLNRIGPEGDKHLVQLNLTTLESAGAQPEVVSQPPPNGVDRSETRIN